MIDMTTNNLTPFDFISPIDTRYYGADPTVFQALHPYLSDKATLQYQLKVEQAIVAVLEQNGVAPNGTSEHVARAVETIEFAEVFEEDQRIHHDIRAIVNCIQRRLPMQYRGYVHLFATSYDVRDSARSLLLRDVTAHVLFPALRQLVGRIAKLAERSADVVQIGRTHGRHAEPITVGYWLANYVERLGERTEKLVHAAANLRGKFSGAVGAHNALGLRWTDPALVERQMLERLGLRPSDCATSSQIVHPEYVCDYMHSIVSTFSVLANLADDARHLMRSELDELAPRDTDTVQSSTMPHKVNPRDYENVKSLWKAFMPRMITYYSDQISEHQRDLTNSASGRFTNELIAGFYYAVIRLDAAMGSVEINGEAVRRNLEASKEWTLAEPLYIALALSGHSDPYETVRGLFRRAREHSVGLRTFLNRPEGQAILDEISPAYLIKVLEPSEYLGDAPERTRFTCDQWTLRLNSPTLPALLARPDESNALVCRWSEGNA